MFDKGRDRGEGDISGVGQREKNLRRPIVGPAWLVEPVKHLVVRQDQEK